MSQCIKCTLQKNGFLLLYKARYSTGVKTIVTFAPYVGTGIHIPYRIYGRTVYRAPPVPFTVPRPYSIYIVQILFCFFITISIILRSSKLKQTVNFLLTATVLQYCASQYVCLLCTHLHVYMYMCHPVRHSTPVVLVGSQPCLIIAGICCRVAGVCIHLCVLFSCDSCNALFVQDSWNVSDVFCV